jgi:hypothetical protein
VLRCWRIPGARLQCLAQSGGIGQSLRAPLENPGLSRPPLALRPRLRERWRRAAWEVNTAVHGARTAASDRAADGGRGGRHPLLSILRPACAAPETVFAQIVLRATTPNDAFS